MSFLWLYLMDSNVISIFISHFHYSCFPEVFNFIVLKSPLWPKSCYRLLHFFSRLSSRFGCGWDFPGKSIKWKEGWGWTSWGNTNKSSRGRVVPKRSSEGRTGDAGWKEKVISWKTREETTADLRRHSSNGNGVGGRSQITNCTWRMNRVKVLNKKGTLFLFKILSYEEKDSDRALAGGFTGQKFFFVERPVCSGIFCNNNESLSIQFMVPFPPPPPPPQPRWLARSMFTASGRG